ncbi:hypothetical protein [Streptomyces sp. NBC_00096]|uniref:hypothetical protein n=1 Tax=Streptomyces sp. NBC_00096 TaxID=2975650 RepID=UPI003249AA06
MGEDLRPAAAQQTRQSVAGALTPFPQGECFGARTALWAGALGELLAVLPLLLSPLRSAREVPR